MNGIGETCLCHRVFAPLATWVMCVLVSLSAMSAGAAVVETNSTWRATQFAPLAGWNVDVVFDTSSAAGWNDAVELSSAVLDGNLVPVIWQSGTGHGGPAQVWLRHVFTLPSDPFSGLLDLSVDDDAQVYINGHLVLDDQSGNNETFLNLDVGAFLVAGSNLIAIAAQDSGGGQGIFARLEVGRRAVSEPNSLSLLAVAMLLLLWPLVRLNSAPRILRL
ncbi:MAG: hypothetical protein JNM79_05225 [Burkholderiales bacterium]|nr:hypothetical protein [Burkholderiales bacterium]